MAQRKLLTEREVAKVKGVGRHSLGGNLLVQIGERGSRSWLARVTDQHRRRREIGLGSCRDVTLGKARERVRVAREAIADGSDPVLALHPEAMPTFEELAREMHAERAATFKNASHCAQWLSSLEAYAFLHIGRLPVDAVTSAEVMKVMGPIWLEKEETARRVLQRIAAVTAYAVPKGFRDQELPVRGIRSALPKQTRGVRHHPACAVSEAPEVYKRIRAGGDSMSSYALRLILLTSARSGEVRGATWSEFDLEAKVWSIPATRMKAKREHRVPLSEEVIELLDRVPRLSSEGELVFPNSRGKPLSDTAVSKVFKRFVPGVTVHGWRSTFKDWATNETNYQDDVSEAALAHVDANRVRAAYKRTDMLEKRRALMEDWAGFLS